MSDNRNSRTSRSNTAVQHNNTTTTTTGHCEDDFGDHGKLFPLYHAGSYVMSSLTLRRLSCKFETRKRTQVYPSEDVLTGILLHEANVRSVRFVHHHFDYIHMSPEITMLNRSTTRTLKH